MTDLPSLFKNFLEEAKSKGWISSYSWSPEKSKGPRHGFSRTHKEDDQGNLWTLEVESAELGRVGVDLEFFVPGRPIFQNPGWLERKFQIKTPTLQALTPEELMEQWAAREAAFKALYPHNPGVVLSDFEYLPPSQLRFAQGEMEVFFDIWGQWQGSWYLALAKRNGAF